MTLPIENAVARFVGTGGMGLDTGVAANAIESTVTDTETSLVTSSAVREFAPERLTEAKTVTVGTGGDYSTINQAIEALQRYHSEGVRATISLLSGFVMSEQVLVDVLDLSWITIEGVDPSTSINVSSLNTVLQGTGGIPAFGVTNGGALPIINHLFEMTQTGDTSLRHGVQAIRDGRAVILPGKGVIDAGHNGINVQDGGSVCAAEAVFRSAGHDGIYCGPGSYADVHKADFSSAGNNGVNCNGGLIDAAETDAQSASTYGAIANRGGTIRGYKIKARKDPNNPSTSDIVVFNGGFILAQDVDGGTNVTPNTFTANGLILGS